MKVWKNKIYGFQKAGAYKNVVFFLQHVCIPKFMHLNDASLCNMFRLQAFETAELEDGMGIVNKSVNEKNDETFGADAIGMMF